MGCMIEADDGDGHTDTATVEILTAVPTPTPTPRTEKRKPVLKEKLISLVKLSFLKKGLQSDTSCREEGSKGERQRAKGKKKLS
ncbi:MAG: hypothetical protein N2V75_12240 [Methanophagales archaeon]|nr:hypothetical protein [Methanophagales archaeon]